MLFVVQPPDVGAARVGRSIFAVLKSSHVNSYHEMAQEILQSISLSIKALHFYCKRTKPAIPEQECHLDIVGTTTYFLSLSRPSAILQHGVHDKEPRGNCREIMASYLDRSICCVRRGSVWVRQHVTNPQFHFRGD
jgi:hypothetical protein